MRRRTGIVDLAGGSVDSLEEFVDFIVGHLFTEVGEDCLYHVSIVPASSKPKHSGN